MPDSLPDYYEILGLPSSASREEIRRRYRELARRYHPDVAKSDDAANRFKDINEANSVLADPSKRTNYDANRKLIELKRQAAAHPPSQASRTAAEQARRQGDKETRRQGDRETKANPQSANRNPQSTDVETVLREAQRAMARLRYRDAEVLARRANRVRRTSLGYEILGDVFRARGSNDEAVAMYSYALQLDRANHSVQMKFDRLVGRPSGPTMAGGAARAARAARRDAPRAGQPARRAATVIASVLAAAALVALLVASTGIGSPATGPWFIDWDWRYILALCLSGGLVGFILAANGALPDLRGALSPPALRRGAGTASPLAPIVIGFSVLSLYAALILYVIAGFLTDRVSKSLLLAFGVSVAVTLMFALVNSAAAWWTLLTGGNLVFVGFMAAWGLTRSAGSTR